MKYIITILTIVIVGFTDLIAQSDFRDGYIIKNNNDTIVGLIDYKGNNSNSKKCIFKYDVNSESQMFFPTDLIAYRFIDGKYYITKQISKSGTKEMIFLEYLINGKTDIFYYRDIEGEHYLIDINGEIHELKKEEFEITIDNVKYIKERPLYVGLLKISFQDSPSISNKVEHINLDHKSLINIAKKYHEEVCPGEECIIYQEKHLKTKIRFGVLIGLNTLSISAIKSFPDDLYYFDNSHFNREISPSIGIFFSVNMPYINEKLFFQYNGTYNKLNLVTANSYYDPIYSMTYLNNISLSQNVINNGFSFKYEISNKKIRPKLILGGFIDYFFQSNYERSIEVLFSWGDPYYTGIITDSPFSKLDYGIIAGFGFTTDVLNGHEIYLDFNYQRGFGLLKGLNTNTFTTSLGFQIFK